MPMVVVMATAAEDVADQDEGEEDDRQHGELLVMVLQRRLHRQVGCYVS